MTPSNQLTSVELRVRDLARSIDFYARQCGLVARMDGRRRATLATASDAAGLLVLEESPAAPEPPDDAAGLFHAALLLPGAASLGSWLQFAASRGLQFDGMSDHGVSEAIYFSDPDGNGLEFYADRPPEEWPYRAGELAMFTQALELPRLLAQAAPPRPEPLAGARWGHVHLRVTDLERSAAFYRGALGLAERQRSIPGALFMAADGYHHHVGLNVWGRPRRPQPSGALGLAHLAFTYAGANEPLERVDPDGMALRIAPRAATAPAGTVP